MRFGIILISLFITGCVGYNHHRVVNIGNQRLYGVKLQLDNRTFSHGYLPPGAHKSYSGGSFKIRKGDKVIVIWGLDEKRRYYKDIFIKKHPWPKEVVFRLNGNDVTVGFERLP